MNTNLLYIPYRETDTIDLGSELRNIIKQEYFQPPSTFETDLITVSNLRKRIANLKDEKAVKDDELACVQYYQQLDNVIKKFPDECVEFAWYGTLGYGRSGPTRIRSLRVEQLNILYQLGCYFSQAALMESRYSDNGLKKSCTYFQYAAGCFDSMILQIQKENEKQKAMIQFPRDLQPPTLLFLKSLMIAQAQETIWQKSLSGEMKDSVIAKLSIKTSEYYSIAADYGNESEFIKLEWINHVTVKKFHFKAAAHYRISILDHESFKYGEQVANLQVATSSCISGLKKKKYVSNLVIEDLQGLTDTIKNTLRVAEKDNDLVYLKPVPKESELAPILGASLVKPIMPPIVQASNDQKVLFKDLLPYIIIQVGQAYRERLDTFINDLFIDPIQSLNKMMYKFITERDLPASIDTIQTPENIPESIIQHSQEIISYGGTKLIQDSFNEIAKLTVESRHLLDGCQERLKIEADEDDIIRQRQGSQRWKRARSHEASEELINKIKKMETYLDQAKEGDQFIRSQYIDIEPYLQIYCGGYDELIKIIPNSTYVKLDSRIQGVIVQLRGLINEVSSLENQRKQFLSRLDIKVRNNNILQAIIDYFKKNQGELFDENGTINERSFEGIYEKHISMFNGDQRILEDLKHKQISLEGKIDDLNQQFKSEYNQTTNESQNKRQEVLQSLENVYTTYLELISNLNEGSNFYSDFITKGNSVLKECDEFVYHRRVEGRELEQYLNNQVVPIISPQPRITREDSQQIERNDENPNLPVDGKGGTWNPSQGIKFG